MNDASEFEYAAELIDGVVADSLRAVTDERLQRVLPSERGVANWFEFASGGSSNW
jgi:hypothetical protein